MLVRVGWRVNKKLLWCLHGNLVACIFAWIATKGILMTICVPFSFSFPQFMHYVLQIQRVGSFEMKVKCNEDFFQMKICGEITFEPEACCSLVI